jgi:hypothetical protein
MSAQLFIRAPIIQMAPFGYLYKAICTGYVICVLEEQVPDEEAALGMLNSTLRYRCPGNLARYTWIADVRRPERERMHTPAQARPDATLPRKSGERAHARWAPLL